MGEINTFLTLIRMNDTLQLKLPYFIHNSLHLDNIESNYIKSY